MTIHFSQFDDVPSALDEARKKDAETRRAELLKLTECPIHLAIEGVCSEPGCPNGVLRVSQPLPLNEVTDDDLGRFALRCSRGIK